LAIAFELLNWRHCWQRANLTFI